jgi:hypothetical protein
MMARMTSLKESNICTCPIVRKIDIQFTRCIGSKPKHKSCGGIIDNYADKRVIQDDRQRIEKR